MNNISFWLLPPSLSLLLFSGGDLENNTQVEVGGGGPQGPENPKNNIDKQAFYLGMFILLICFMVFGGPPPPPSP
jgi:hypothetical protein